MCMHASYFSLLRCCNTRTPVPVAAKLFETFSSCNHNFFFLKGGVVCVLGITFFTKKRTLDEILDSW